MKYFIGFVSLAKCKSFSILSNPTSPYDTAIGRGYFRPTSDFSTESSMFLVFQPIVFPKVFYSGSYFNANFSLFFVILHFSAKDLKWFPI